MDNGADSLSEKWFISDTRISGEAEDAFSHIDYARELKAKIVELPPPLTIALAGEHGTGKSSIGVLLEGQFKNDTRFEFVRIEAWRHEGESRRKAFLYDVLEGMAKRFEGDRQKQAELEELKQKLYSSHARQTAVLDLTGAKDSLRALWEAANRRAVLVASILAIITILVLIAWYFHTVQTTPTLARAALLATIPSTLSLPIVVSVIGYFGSLLKQTTEKILEPARITVTTNPPSSAEQYEQIFRQALQILVRGSKVRKTMVIFVDELDRLPPGEIIEALKAIRTFRDVEPCVFVVGLDESVVRKAIVESKVGVGLVEDSAEAEEFLNKFFKQRQHVPLLVSRDMREFARGLVTAGPRRRIGAGVAALPKDRLDDVLDALIHRQVKTPRHVIRLLNAFNGDYRLASVREKAASGLLSPGAVSDSLPFLALIAVLREDYPDFYDELVRNPDLLRALDMFLAGKTLAEVSNAYPTYPEICVPYFTLRPSEGNPAEATTDFGTYLPRYRDLFLHLRNTEKFRAPSIIPFVYLREDQAARLLGSAAQQMMAEEFQNNGVSSLRARIRNGGESYATAAAQVGMVCLEEGRGLDMENTILASSEIFEDIDPALRAEFANRVALKAFQNRGSVTRVEPSAFLRLLGEATPGVYVDGCIDALIARLNPDDLDTGRNVLNGLVDHSSVVSENVDLHRIRDYTAALAAHLPVADLDRQVDGINGKHPEERILEGFFGKGFLQAAATAVSVPAASDLPSDLAAHMAALFSLMAPSALAGWPEEYFSSAVSMLDGRTWGIHEVGFSILRANIQELSEPLCCQALGTLYAKDNVAKVEDDFQHHRLLHEFTLGIAERFGLPAFQDERIRSGINSYLEATMAAPDQALRATLQLFLKALVATAGPDYFGTFAKAAVAYVTAESPSDPAFDTLKIVGILSPGIAQTEMQGLYDGITLRLRQGATVDEARFGADALVDALQQGAPDMVRTVAETYLTGMIGMVSGAYAPANLLYVARVLDMAFPSLGPNIPAYISNLGGYIGTQSDANIIFGLARLKRVATIAASPPASKAEIANVIVGNWDFITGGHTREDAADLLSMWRDQIPEGLRPTFYSQQAELLDSAPVQAWRNLGAFWRDLPQAMRISVLVRGLGKTEVSSIIMVDIADAEHKLGDGEVGGILTSASSQIDGALFAALAEALTSQFDEREKQEASTLLFTALSEQPEKLSQAALLMVASSLAKSVMPQSLAYFVELLRGDQAYRAFAFDHLPSYLEGTSPQPEQLQELASAMAEGIAGDSLELIARNINLAKTLDVIGNASYSEALQRKQQELKGSKSNGDKLLLKMIQENLRR